MEKRPSRVSGAQWELLLDYLEKNPTLARGYNNTAQGRRESHRLWEIIANLLNAQGFGVTKTPKEWSVYVSNFKSKLKKIVSTINADASGTGGGPPQGSSLSEYDSRFLAILGPGFGQAAPGVRVDPFPNQDPLRPEIKQESVLLTNGYHRENNENDRLSESEDENSPQQSDDEVEEDQSSEEPTVKNLYPQWLVEVEKKRAEAELRRAKAEEMKAEVAVKNAEAAFVQSQAIRKLAEAADRQADAVLRIAMLLESRRSRDDILNL